MISQEVSFQIRELSTRVAVIEKSIAKIERESVNSESEWDNATLMRKWGICKRTAANYRQKGLEYFKRGGVIFYTQECREKFIQTNKSILKREI